MSYNIYYKGNKVKLYNGDKLYKVYHTAKGKHVWPEDNTVITLSYDSANQRINFTLSNLSDRTQYLVDNGLIGAALFVEERHVYCSNKWRSTQSKENHPSRRCMGVIEDCGTSGYFDLTNNDYEMSDALNRYFAMQADYEGDPAQTGTDIFSIGIGRYSDMYRGFRPHKMSDSITISRNNPYL